MKKMKKFKGSRKTDCSLLSQCCCLFIYLFTHTKNTQTAFDICQYSSCADKQLNKIRRCHQHGWHLKWFLFSKLALWVVSSLNKILALNYVEEDVDRRLWSIVWRENSFDKWTDRHLQYFVFDIEICLSSSHYTLWKFAKRKLNSLNAKYRKDFHSYSLWTEHIGMWVKKTISVAK